MWLMRNPLIFFRYCTKYLYQATLKVKVKVPLKFTVPYLLCTVQYLVW